MDYSQVSEKKEESVSKEMHLDDSQDAVLFGLQILQEAENEYSNLSGFRDNYQRNKKFIFGQQWEDEMDDPDNDGDTITEKDYIIRQGKNPLVTNYLGPLVKNLKGQYRNQDNKPAVRSRKKEDQLAADMLTNALQSVYDGLGLQELDAAQFYQSLLSSAICWKNTYDWIKHRNLYDVYSKNVSVNRLLFNTDISDPRGHDIRLIGEIIDAPIESLYKAYAEDEREREIIKEWYNECSAKYQASNLNQLGDSVNEDNIDFYSPHNSNMCRVFEIWKEVSMKKVIVHDPEDADIFQVPGSDVEMAEEQIKAENAVRELQGRPPLEYEIKYEDVWCYYMLTPNGKVLDSGETPYEHESHPFTFRIPILDGKYRAFLDDTIDMQKMLNRQVILQDFIVSSSSKSLLMIPDDIKPDGWSWDDYEAQHSKIGGMIVYKPSSKHNQIPQEISSNARSVTSEQLLQFASKSMKEISGVTEAIQGQTPKSGTPASLYQEQANNATLATKDLFDFFASARKERDYKLVKLMQQHYTTPCPVLK